MTSTEKKEKKEKRTVEITEVKEILRKVITEKYGGVAKFIATEQGKKFGGKKIRTYFYSKGSVNFELMQELCKYFGVGNLTRKLKVIREYSYFIEE